MSKKLPLPHVAGDTTSLPHNMPDWRKGIEAQLWEPWSMYIDGIGQWSIR